MQLLSDKFLYCFADRNTFLKSLPKNSLILELGVFRGENAQFLLDNLSPRHLSLVDTWFLSSFEDLLDSTKSPFNNSNFDIHKPFHPEIVAEYKTYLESLAPNVKSGDARELMEQIFYNCKKGLRDPRGFLFIEMLAKFMQTPSLITHWILFMSMQTIHMSLA